MTKHEIETEIRRKLGMPFSQSRALAEVLIKYRGEHGDNIYGDKGGADKVPDLREDI